MKPVAAGRGIYELVLLDGLPSKRVSNSNEPQPNSLHTRDLFRRHPTLDAWYYLGRQDDRITLSKGEKILPLPLESAIIESPLVRQALVFGDGREFPGLLVFRSEKAVGMDDGAVVDAVWPIVEKVNATAESFAYISRAMMVILGTERDYPRTDKSTIIRGEAYAMFKDEIDAAYEAWVSATEVGAKTMSIHSVDEMLRYLVDLCREELGLSLRNVHESLFAGGLDSLKASQLVAHIRREVKIDGKRVQHITVPRIYQCGTLIQLAESLWDPRTQEGPFKMEAHVELDNLIERFGTFAAGMSRCTRSVSAVKTLVSPNFPEMAVDDG